MNEKVDKQLYNSAVFLTQATKNKKDKLVAYEQYKSTAKIFKGYLQNLDPKINEKWQLEHYKNYLKGQKLNLIKLKLQKQKQNLQLSLKQKINPINSINGHLYKELNYLKELEDSYKSMRTYFEKIMRERAKQIEEKTLLLRNQKQKFKKEIINNLSDTFQNNVKLPSIKKNSRKRNSSFQEVLIKLNNNMEEMYEERIVEEEEKLILLKMLIGYIKRENEQKQQTILGELAIKNIEQQMLIKSRLLQQIKQILNKKHFQISTEK